MINRTLSNFIKDRISSYPAIAIIGPRQSGKTILVRSSFPQARYVTLEDPDTQYLVRSDARGFLAGLGDMAIIDEIQRVPELLSYLQTIIDEPGNTRRFILTGSNQFLLMKHVSQSLAGRILICKLLPFACSEIENSDWRPIDADRYMFAGSYPRIYNESLKPTEWYQSYIETYLEKDLKDFIQVSDLTLFRKFVMILASQCGQLCNLNSIAIDLGISHNTVKAWLAALEKSFIIFLLQPYHRNFNKRISKTPKLYFYDTGLACALLRITAPEALANHFIRGQLFENMVIADMQKEIMHRHLPIELFFWRDHSGHEVDCLYEQNGRINVFEIKSSQTINASFFKGIEFFRNLAPGLVEHPVLIYGGEEQQEHSGVQIRGWRQVRQTIGQ